MAPNNSAFPACPKQGAERARNVTREETACKAPMSCNNINVIDARQPSQRDVSSDRMTSQRMPEIETSLGTLRRKRGFSAIHLAEQVGVSRQTIYAMEAGTYVPNTAVALRLARALDTAVEELFTLADSVPPPKLRSELATLLPGSGAIQE